MEFSNHHGNPVAYIVENNILVDAVEKELKQVGNITVLNNVGVEEYKLPKTNYEPVEILMTDGQQLTCNLLVSQLHLPFIHFPV